MTVTLPSWIRIYYLCQYVQIYIPHINDLALFLVEYQGWSAKFPHCSWQCSSQTILAKPEQKATTSDTKRTEQTSYPLQVAYPLRQTKLVVTSPYGWRKHPVTGVRSFHNGVDLRANFEPVYAMLPGEVVSTGFEPKGGYYITLRHGSIHVSYCHLSFIGVKKGSSVFSGQAIGISGNSGTSTTGPHLHLSLSNNGVYSNPVALFQLVH